ncbi:hypothetical protein Fcan01_21119 [Folsomia candida]|uniref:Uncharacterized protein n=1 Tax=Folsomia candida TaxID=158441 RepID=A0A226DG18_FOLCA|nr:hypothetical protein Fcan01_21119 [Folsomia candida]
MAHKIITFPPQKLFVGEVTSLILLPHLTSVSCMKLWAKMSPLCSSAVDRKQGKVTQHFCVLQKKTYLSLKLGKDFGNIPEVCRCKSERNWVDVDVDMDVVVVFYAAIIILLLTTNFRRKRPSSSSRTESNPSTNTRKHWLFFNPISGEAQQASKKESQQFIHTQDAETV